MEIYALCKLSIKFRGIWFCELQTEQMSNQKNWLEIYASTKKF